MSGHPSQIFLSLFLPSYIADIALEGGHARALLAARSRHSGEQSLL
jgi:hypothetical protein